MRAIGFNQGQFGDLCMNLVACRAFKEQHPDGHLTFGINRKYSALSPIFERNPLIDAIHFWEGYDNWPTSADYEFLNKSQFDKVYHPMQSLRPAWQPVRHQTEEICLVHGLTPPKDLSIKFNKFFETDPYFRNCIVVSGSGVTEPHKKNISDERILEICKLIEGLGYHPIFLHNSFQCYTTVKKNFFDSVKVLLSCKAMVTIDTSLCWIASGYEFPVVGLYNSRYYESHGATTSKNWQPINPNAIYLESENPNLIPVDSIEQSLKAIL